MIQKKSIIILTFLVASSLLTKAQNGEGILLEYYVVPNNVTIYKSVTDSTQITLSAIPGGSITRKKIVKDVSGVEFEVKEVLTSPPFVYVPFKTKEIISHPQKIKTSIIQKNDTLYLNPYLGNPPAIRNAKPFLQLADREAISLKYRAIELGALTVPIKYRFGKNIVKNDTASVNIAAQTLTDINLGVYVGHTRGIHVFRYRKNENLAISKYSFTSGVFLSLGTIKLDSTSTSAYWSLEDKKFAPLKNEHLKPAFSMGFSTFLNIRDVRAGFFFGWDIPFGEYSKRWNYYGKPWIGFGLGYNLGFLKKS